jgi:hypothetical protein
MLMSGYIVTQRMPKKQKGKFQIRVGVILAENIEEGLKLAKEQMPHFPEDGWDIVRLEPHKVFNCR